MISEDFAFFGFDDTSWDRLVSLFLGDDVSTPRPRGVLVVVVDRDGRPVVCFHTARGSLDPTTLPAPADLRALCDATAAGACIVMRERAMPGLADYLVEPLDPEQDFVARVMRFTRVLRELGNGNILRVWPNPLPNLLLSAAPAASKPAVDILLPDDHCALAGVFFDEGLWTAAVLRRRGGSFDLLAGPQAISSWAGPLGGDWRRDHRVLVQAVERELGPVHIGLFMDLPTARMLFGQRKVGGWALAYATRQLLIQPLPGYATAALGIDGLAGVAQFAVQALEEMDPDEVATLLTGFWRGLTDGKGIEGLLGFSPTQVISEVLEEKLSQPPEAVGAGNGPEDDAASESENADTDEPRKPSTP